MDWFEDGLSRFRLNMWFQDDVRADGLVDRPRPAKKVVRNEEVTVWVVWVRRASSDARLFFEQRLEDRHLDCCFGLMNLRLACDLVPVEPLHFSVTGKSPLVLDQNGSHHARIVGPA